MGEFFRRIYFFLNRRKLDRELLNDMAVHREMLGDDRKDFGNPTLLAEQSHEAIGWGWIEHLAFFDRRLALVVLKFGDDIRAGRNYRAVGFVGGKISAHGAIVGFQVEFRHSRDVFRCHFFNLVTVQEEKAPVSHGAPFAED